MVNPLTVIRNFVAANTGVVALCGPRVYWGTTMPAGYSPDTGPAILLNTRGGSQDYTSVVLSPTIVAQCVAATDLQAWGVASALYDALNDKTSRQLMMARQSQAPQLIYDEQSRWSIALVYYDTMIRNVP